MPAKASVTLEGFKELGENLRGIDAELRAKIGFRAVYRVMKQTRDDALSIAQSVLQSDTGALFRNIAIARNTKDSSPLSFVYDVGVRHGSRKQKKQTKAEGRNVNDPYYWFMHEFGYTHRGGGQVGPTPFLTPAFARRQADGLAMMGDTLWKGIEKANKPKTGSGK